MADVGEAVAAAVQGSSQVTHQQRHTATATTSDATPTDSSKPGLPLFNSYMSLLQVQEKLKKGEVIEGVLRINPKNYEDAYISAPGGGTDIYIGGVHDRNAALHGDRVAIELLPQQHWKVLYDQLDFLLDSDESLKSLIYCTHDPFAEMDVFVPPGTSAVDKKQEGEEDQPSAKDVSDNVNKSNCQEEDSTKKKKGRRRGKNSSKSSKELADIDCDEVNVGAEEVVVGLLADPPVQYIQDELMLLSCNTRSEAATAEGTSHNSGDDDGNSSGEDDRMRTTNYNKKKKKKAAVVVPPDMLSECEDITDDESCCSDALDYEQGIEDRNFFIAQQRAASAAAAAAAASQVGSGGNDIHSGVKIVDVTEDQQVPTTAQQSPPLQPQQSQPTVAEATVEPAAVGLLAETIPAAATTGVIKEEKIVPGKSDVDSMEGKHSGGIDKKQTFIERTQQSTVAETTEVCAGGKKLTTAERLFGDEISKSKQRKKIKRANYTKEEMKGIEKEIEDTMRKSGFLEEEVTIKISDKDGKIKKNKKQSTDSIKAAKQGLLQEKSEQQHSDVNCRWQQEQQQHELQQEQYPRKNQYPHEQSSPHQQQYQHQYPQQHPQQYSRQQYPQQHYPQQQQYPYQQQYPHQHQQYPQQQYPQQQYPQQQYPQQQYTQHQYPHQQQYAQHHQQEHPQWLAQQYSNTAVGQQGSGFPVYGNNDSIRHHGPPRQGMTTAMLNTSASASTTSRHSTAAVTRTDPSVKQVMRLPNWDRFIQRVAMVVHILEKRNTRLGAGILKPFAMNKNFALFSPNDNRVPRMKIPISQCPADFLPRKFEYAKRIYLAKIVQWTEAKFAIGELIRDIGQHGEIAAESEAFLLQVGIDYSDFTEEVLKDLPDITKGPWTISAETLSCRTDMRESCVFTIDPATARDLDDAVSCSKLPCGGFRVAVHIADVTYFVHEATELDKAAAERATSVYLIDKVIPMLPRLLCQELCSLNPDEDRLAFTVVWEMSAEARVLSTWFGRTVVRSCAKLSYDHAQKIIENPDKLDWSNDEMPSICQGFGIKDICNTVTNLYALSQHMRKNREEKGALRLDQKKVAFNLDSQTKMPNSVDIHEIRESNKLIEEFMLLANTSVAQKIYDSFPSDAILRCHPAPIVGQLTDAVKLLHILNIEIDPSTAESIYISLQQYFVDDDNDAEGKGKFEVIVNMLSKPMQNALYFHSGTYTEEFSHYALNVPYYTHFTSPIRRYPDIMVHRMLAAAIDSDRFPLKNEKISEVLRRLVIANEHKQTAKRASEYSCELYLAQFVRRVGEYPQEGMIIGLLDHAVDILLLKFCTIKRCYLEKLPLEALHFNEKDKNVAPTINLIWSPDHVNKLPSIAQTLTYFSQVNVVLTPFTNGQLKFNTTIVRPMS